MSYSIEGNGLPDFLSRFKKSDIPRLPVLPSLDAPRNFPDPILKPEQVAEMAKNQTRNYETISPTFGIPMQFSESTIVENAHLLETTGNKTLDFNNLHEIGLSLFDSDRVNFPLENTIRRLTQNKKARIESLWGWPVTFGSKAYILMYEAQVDGRNMYFVTHLARDPFSNSENVYSNSQLAFIDYQQLLSVSKSFKQFLTEEQRAKVDVVEPLWPGIANFQGSQYMFFTMPFVPYGEINIKAITGSSGKQMSRCFDYALPLTQQMRDRNDIQQRVAYQRSQQVVNTNSFMSLNTPQFQSQRKDYLAAYFYLWTFSGTGFPRDHHINSGDIMGTIEENHLNHLVWITLRGTLAQVPTIEELFDKIRSIGEINPQISSDEVIFPYKQMSDNDLLTIANEVSQKIFFINF